MIGQDGSAPLLTTKLHVPQVAPDLVTRPQLVERLDRGLTRQLALVSAPAGFGKSTLVAAWLAARGRHAAWLSLDTGDNDPARFWSYLIAAIQSVHPDVAEARQMVGAPQLRSAEPVVVSLLNEIAGLAGDLTVVLDDYHVIREAQIHEGLGYLLEHQPANLHLVLITRVDPPLSLARLRAHRRLVEIRAADLQFSVDEAARLFDDTMDLRLQPEQVAALHTRTEGWIVSLQLAALSLRGHAAYDAFIERFTGSHQFILDYLTEEVLRALPEPQRRFLPQTSILDRFCGGLCCAVTGDEASSRMLDEIRRANLFLIPLEAGGLWYRYHHLFAHVLQALLERDHPDEVTALHLKAAAWFEDQGYPDEAVEHALRSGDTQRARELVLRHWASAFYRGEVATVLRWLDELPRKVERDDPSVSLARCWALFLSGHTMSIEPYLEQAQSAYGRLLSEGTLEGPQRRLVAAQLAMMRSVLARGSGDHAGSAAHAEEAARLVPPEMVGEAGTAWNMLGAALAGAGDYEGTVEAYSRGIELTYEAGNLVGAHTCSYGRTMYLMALGRLDEADRFSRSVIERGQRDGHGDIPAAGWSHLAVAQVAFARNRLDSADAHLADGLRLARPGGFGELLCAGRCLRASIAAARGDGDGAVAILQETERIVDAMDDPYLKGDLARGWVSVCVHLGDLGGARLRLARLDRMCNITQHANLLHARDWLSAGLLTAEGRYGEALAELAAAIERARASHGDGFLVRLLALQSVAFHGLGKRESARSALREGLVLGARGGRVRYWLDAGPSIALLLRDVIQDDLPPSAQTYLDMLLDVCRSVFGDAARQPASKLLDPLTTRELEIVRLICAGHSGPEIAEELVLAYNTVRKHTSNIYSKLGVRSRTQAVARVRDLDLL